MDALSDAFCVAALAQALLHFAWQGAVVGAAAFGMLQIVRPRRPQTRYALYCLTLALLAGCFAGTLVFETLSTHDARAFIPRQPGLTSPYETPLVASRQPSNALAPIATSSRALTAVVQAWIDRHRVGIAIGWLVGVVIFSARLALGTLYVCAVVRRGQTLPPEWSTRVERLARHMCFRAAPAVRVVGHVSQAMAVGLFRPIVLLPAAWVSELNVDVLEAVIAHELAHLRRWDLPINLAQRLIEAVLFFHPVVWWCSRQIRLEREMCCDEAAVAALGSPVSYAKALSHLAQHGGSLVEPAWSAGIGGPKMVLLERIRHVLGMTSSGHSRLHGPAWALIGAAAASLVWGALVMVREPQSPAGHAHSPAVPEPIHHPPQARTGVISPELMAQINASRGSHADALERLPTEHDKTLLPSYTIEPPDVLFIDAMRVVPKAPYHLQTGDVVQINVEPPEANLSGSGFFVDSQGRLDLGTQFGRVQLRGMTSDEAAEAVKKAVAAVYPDPVVSLNIVKSAPMQPITGEHLVSPDGQVNLGTYGQVAVADLTIAEAKQKIEEHLSEFLESPQVSVAVFAYNSKVYYVIVEGGGEGDRVYRCPIVGNETVLDAVSQVNGLRELSTKEIFIARPEPAGARQDKVLPVNWQEIARGASTVTNYQVFPGDRIFIVDRPTGSPATN